MYMAGASSGQSAYPNLLDLADLIQYCQHRSGQSAYPNLLDYH